VAVPELAHTQLTLAAAGASGTWVWEIRSGIIHVDSRFAELYGLDRDQALAGLPAATFFKAIHPDDRARIKIAVAGILAGAELFSKEFRIVGPGGAILWMHGRGQCEYDVHDDPLRFSGLLVDVTERKRTEERLRIAQTAGGVGTFEYVDGFATVAVSDEFCRLLGLHSASVLPVQTINALLEAGQQHLIPEPRSLVAPEAIDAVFRIKHGEDGSDRWIARRGEILREGSGYRLIGVIYDVTAAKEQEAALRELNETLESRVELEVAVRHKAEETLRQAYKMDAIGQLTGGVAHDFNNLLMAISSSLEMLQKRVPDDPQTLRLIRNAQQGAERGAALTQRMLAFARRQDLRSERIDVGPLIRGMVDLIDRTLGPSWPLALSIPEELPSISADANQVELALLNLAVNARDAMPLGGQINIVATQRNAVEGQIADLGAGDYVILSVIDSGIGMDAETLQRASEPFFTTKGVGKGTGLGLSMIHGLARQLNGTFLLQSKVGVGTVAELWLPASVQAEPPTPAMVHEMPIAASGRSFKIIVVDDDVLILMNTVAMLEDLGHHVLEASSGEEVLQLLEVHPDVDLLITDQAMPGMSGVQLAEKAVERLPDLPIILATGYGEIPEEVRGRIVKLGKPYSQTLLSQTVEKAIQAVH
jgi:PAS domain S-box-containing protein